ncbi:MAG: 50S ribosomal protein L25 [Acidobacteria bacterium]|nr:50S ribosomal protein L25 [Acidobacteriota bacterium]
MANASLSAELGRPTGSAASRRLRSDDKIPGVLYGHGMAPVALSVARRDLRSALSGPAGVNTIIDLNVGGATYPTIVKELQRHPVRRTVSHIDFQQISMTEEIVVSVPINLSGTAKAVVADGGLVDAAVDSIEVRTTPSSMPNEILIDITNMTVNDVIHLRDIAMPAGVTAVGDPDLVVVTVLTTRAEAPTAAAAPADGAAPAAGAAPSAS